MFFQEMHYVDNGDQFCP